jgi:hypothetical protein
LRCEWVFLVAASPAAADSILFVRDGNVWISTPDGTTERPLTAGGGFSSPSMADDGTIVALRGRSFVRLRPDGAAIGMPIDAIGGDWVVRRARRGTLRLRVPLNAKAKRALARSGRLALWVRVTVRAPGRATTTARRPVTLRG